MILKKKIEQLLNGKFEYEQPQLLFPLSAVIGRINVAVQVGGKIDRQLFFVHRLPPCQLHADLR